MFFLVLLFSFFWLASTPTLAASCTCDFVELSRNPDGSVVYGCPDACTVSDVPGGTVGVKCDPPEEACNQNYNYDQYVGCCQSEAGGGGGGGCSWSQVNCPSGWTRGGEVVQVSCGTSYCPAPGTAQASTGCCGNGFTDENGEFVCANGQVTTYNCCAPGSPWACQVSDTGGTVTTLQQWSSRYSCGDSDGIDVFISTTQSNVERWRYKTCDGDWDPNTEKCEGSMVWVIDYYWNTTCQDYLKSCACTPICSAGTAPTLTSPADAAIYSGPSGAASVAFDWEEPSSWGSQETGTDRSYTLCVGANSSDPCNGGQTFTVGSGASPTTETTQSITSGTKYWGVKANNMCGMSSSISTLRNICVEGHTLPGDAGVGNVYYSQWGACNVNTHKRTRTCAEDCGTDNCTAAAAAGLLEEDCEAEIRGTLFDATNLTSCPSFDPNTGYLIGVDTTLTPNNRTFDIADQSNVPTHPWASITAPETDSSGNYNVRVYAPATYSYDFNDLRDMYIVSTGPKLTCVSSVAVVPGNPTNCGTQPCTVVNNMSFGFERYWGGWWQVQGAGVHGETGFRSSIPTALPSEQSLILPDPTTGNRRGIASYGVASDTMLGVNTNAKVSASLWQALSNYDGVIYDHAYFNQQFKKYATTVWDGISPISYDDNGSGYQIFKVTGNVTDFNYNPTGTQKVIFLVSGDVTINSNIVVPDGAFLAVLSSGSISFGTSVTSVDGWYLADSIYVRCVDANADTDCDRTDVQFVGNGSFVGWERIVLSRDRGGDTNILGPSEKFNYRMDLYNNAPDPMKIFTKKYKPYVP